VDALELTRGVEQDVVAPAGELDQAQVAALGARLVVELVEQQLGELLQQIDQRVRIGQRARRLLEDLSTAPAQRIASGGHARQGLARRDHRRVGLDRACIGRERGLGVAQARLVQPTDPEQQLGLVRRFTAIAQLDLEHAHEIRVRALALIGRLEDRGHSLAQPLDR
jgi:hypothetical protein